MTTPEPLEASGPTEAQVTAAENLFSLVVLVAIASFLDRVRTAVMAPWKRFGRLPDPSPILNEDQFWTARVDSLMDDLVKAARVGWNVTESQLNSSIPFDRTDPILLDQLAATRNLLVNVNNELYRKIVKDIASGIDQGWSNARIAERIESLLDANGAENWPNRADVIARTEVRRFTSAGQISAALRFQASRNVRMVKEWVDRHDDRVRSAHRDVDGQVRELADLFDVGRSRLLYPGDPRGAASDVVNERCRLKIRRER